MTTDQLLDEILRREGGGRFTNDPADRGGPTKYGITARTLANYRGMSRSATIAEVRSMTEDEARAIYRKYYIAPYESIPFEAVRAQVADFAVTSGHADAVKALQASLGVTADGIIGERTKTAMYAQPQRFTNNALVAFRVRHFAAIAAKDPSQKKWG